MLTFSHVLGGVLLYLGHPAESVLARGLICEVGLDKVTFYLTELNMTDENWLLMKHDLYVNADQAEYSLGAFPSFGRPVLVETKDEANPYHVRSEVSVIDFQDRQLLYSGPNQAGSFVAPYAHSARSMSIYIRDGEKKIAVDPMPGESSVYTIYYEPDRVVPQSLTDNAFPLEQFGGLLKAAIALPCLAHCGYEDTKHKRLQESIQAELIGYDGQFRQYIKQDSQPKSAIGRGFMTDDWGVWDF